MTIFIPWCYDVNINYHMPIHGNVSAKKLTCNLLLYDVADIMHSMTFPIVNIRNSCDVTTFSTNQIALFIYDHHAYIW